MRLSAYAAPGGFESLATPEDERLVRRLGRNGARTLATPNLSARTSGRTDAKAPGGFAAYLWTLMKADQLTSRHDPARTQSG